MTGDAQVYAGRHSEMDPAKQHIDLDASGTIAADVPCIQCGYNLRGLDFEGRCPECDQPISASVDDLLLARRRAQADSGLPLLFFTLGAFVFTMFGFASGFFAALLIGFSTHPFIGLAALRLLRNRPYRHGWAAVCALLISCGVLLRLVWELIAPSLH